MNAGVNHAANAFLERIDAARGALARALAASAPPLPDHAADRLARDAIECLVFLRLCADRGIEERERLRRASGDRLATIAEQAGARFHSSFLGAAAATFRLAGDTTLASVISSVCQEDSATLPVDILGRVHERFLGRPSAPARELGAGPPPGSRAAAPNGRKASGVYYTPRHIVDHVVAGTLEPLFACRPPSEIATLRIADPACGSGAFLLGAYDYLLARHGDFYSAREPEGRGGQIHRSPGGKWRLALAERRRILVDCIFGVDLDEHAVEVTRLSLLLRMLEGQAEAVDLPDLAANIRPGDALVGPDFHAGRHSASGESARAVTFDWVAAFPQAASGFDAVVGNPPWGQKAIAGDDDAREYLRRTYPSATGIFDLFRPFVERGTRLLRDGGCLGMVLPDIVLLKDYQATRRFLLDHTALLAIDWWGGAFADAAIDAVTLVARREPAPASHLVCVHVRDPQRPVRHWIAQADFEQNPRNTFNLHLTPERRRVLDGTAWCPRLADFFEVHEGVHSGNMRRELFLESPVDETCRPLVFGGDEVRAYSLCWAGKHVRLGALPRARRGGRYANLGRAEWYHGEKLLVRRTGDHVIAATDRDGFYASNNFFVVVARASCGLAMDGLAALLNSGFMTWYFRAIEPRRGRRFAELKIKHMEMFPLPVETETGAVARLNALGVARAVLAAELRAAAAIGAEVVGIERRCRALDDDIESTVHELYRLDAAAREVVLSDG